MDCVGWGVLHMLATVANYRDLSRPNREPAMRMTFAVLAAVPASLLMMTATQAATVCINGDACDTSQPAAEGVAQTPDSPPVVSEPSPLVLIPFQDSTGWNYAFSVPTQALSVAMPYFADSEIFAVTMSDGWTYAVGEPGADGAAVATWQNLSSTPASSSTISFKSTLSPSEATYQFMFDDGSTRSYQLFIPYSPSASLAGYTSFAASVPEPSAASMLALGLVATLAAYRRRNMQG